MAAGLSGEGGCRMEYHAVRIQLCRRRVLVADARIYLGKLRTFWTWASGKGNVNGSPVAGQSRQVPVSETVSPRPLVPVLPSFARSVSCAIPTPLCKYLCPYAHMTGLTCEVTQPSPVGIHSSIH